MPKLQRKSILNKVHESHSGIVKTKALLRALYYWPGMMSDAKNMVEACDKCQAWQPSLQQQTWQETICKSLMEQVGIDLFEFGGCNYLAMIDRFSGFLFFAKLRSTVTTAIIAQITKWFYDWGWPDKIRSDGGPQFQSEFKEFCNKHSISHEVSSPYYPQSNGLAEAGVKMAKQMLRKVGSGNDTVAHALQEFRNTPRAEGYSPAQLMLGRRQRASLPCHHEAYAPIDIDKAKGLREAVREKAVNNFNQYATILQDLKIGDEVRVQDPKSKEWNVKGQVTQVLHNGRSYEVI